MIATAEDVLAGFAALWRAAGVPQAVAGGLFDRGLPAGTPLPFALVRAQPGAPQTWAGPGGRLEAFVVTVWVHTREGEAGERRAAAQALQALDRRQSLWRPEFGRCLHVRPLAPPADPSPVADSVARDVAVTAAAWEVLIQQSAA